MKVLKRMIAPRPVIAAAGFDNRVLNVNIVLGLFFAIEIGILITSALATAEEFAESEMLLRATIQGDIQAVQQRLSAGIDPSLTNDYGVTPLSVACQEGNEAIAAALIDGGAPVDQRLPGRVTALMLASRSGSVAMVDRLLQGGADINAQQRSGQTPLMFAAAEGHADVIDRLIVGGAEIDATLDSGFSAIMFAARQGHITATLRLLEHGVDINTQMQPKRTNGRAPRKGMTPLMLAVESAHYELAIELVKRGADPNEQFSEYAPLHALSWVRRPQKGDNPEGDPPPVGSGELSSLEFVRQLVKLGADVNLQLRRGKAGRGRLNTRGATPLLMAAQTVDLPLMELLLQLGADPLLTNVDRCNPLMAAAGVGNHHVGEHEGTPQEVEQAVKMLIDLGLDINAVDKNGETAMHGAAYRCFPETVFLVAKLGAEPEFWNHPNKYGWTPLKIAQGHRPGSFKPDPATIHAITELLNASQANGSSSGPAK